MSRQLDDSMARVATFFDARAEDKHWGDSISEQRKSELRALQQEWDASSGGRRSPFSGVALSGADVFWLAACALAGGREDTQAAEARLTEAQIDRAFRISLDLSRLHLEDARLTGANLDRADLSSAHLDGAGLSYASLIDADLSGASLKSADLSNARLERANMREARLERAILYNAHLDHSFLSGAHFETANLHGARLIAAFLDGAHLERAHLDSADLSKGNLFGTHFENANLSRASLERANMYQAHLDHARLEQANLTRAVLVACNFRGAELVRASLNEADLRGATFDKESRLNGVFLNHARLDQARLDEANLAVVEWRVVRRLGDEIEARQARKVDVGYDDNEQRVEQRVKRKCLADRAEEYHIAGRTYRSVSVALRGQGMASQATRFHYRAELMDRYALLFDMTAKLLSPRFFIAPLLFVRWLVSWALGTFAGYGDYFGRLLITYVGVILIFACGVLAVDQVPLSWPGIRDALVFSVTSFHGRGVQPPGLQLNDFTAALAGLEAVFGLLIEGLFIAAFTRRVTGT